jgi:penicillin amidase
VTATPAEEAAAAAALLRLHDSLGSLRVLGSNNWAVAGSLTASGRPIVANDPHQRLESPSLMYAQHLNSADAGGTLDVAGFAFAATPGVQLGHNRYVIWSATTNFGDTMDIWEVELLDDAVRIAGEVVPGVVREEVIAIRGEPPVSLFFLDIPGRGVVLPADLAPLPVARPGYALLFDWTGFDVGLTRELLEFNRATSLDEFDAAIDRLGAGFNFIAADAAGIGYRVGHVIPDRGPPAGKPEPWLVMDGAVAASYWTGAALPPERLPHSRDPARGWLASANNDPFGFTANGRVDDDPWYYGGLFEPGFRATRIEAELTRLAERGAVDVADMQALQRDVRSPLADELVPMALDVHARAATDDALAALRDRPDVDRAVAALAGWDRRMARDSAGAVAFHAFVHLLAREVLRDDIGVFFEPAVELAPETVLKVTALTMLGVYGDELVPEGRDAALARALVATAEWLDVRFGASPYALADAHATVFAAPFSGRLELPAVPTQGGEDTIDVSPSRTFDGVEPADRWDSSYGPLFRLVGTFDEDGAPSVQYCAAPGQSADPDSAHAADLVADWAEGRYRPLRTRRADVEADATWYTLPAGAR